jgi:hypothetical protein
MGIDRRMTWLEHHLPFYSLNANLPRVAGSSVINLHIVIGVVSGFALVLVVRKVRLAPVHTQLETYDCCALGDCGCWCFAGWPCFFESMKCQAAIYVPQRSSTTNRPPSSMSRVWSCRRTPTLASSTVSQRLTVVTSPSA